MTPPRPTQSKAKIPEFNGTHGSNRIRLRITRDNGHTSDVSIAGEHVTPVMIEAAEALLHAMSFVRPRRRSPRR